MSWRIKESYVSAVIDGTEVCQANVDRVAIYFTNFGPQACFLTTVPFPQPIDAGIGLPVDTPVGFQWSLDGWLARTNFYLRGPVNMSVHVAEVIYYPDGEP